MGLDNPETIESPKEADASRLESPVDNSAPLTESVDRASLDNDSQPSVQHDDDDNDNISSAAPEYENHQSVGTETLDTVHEIDDFRDVESLSRSKSEQSQNQEHDTVGGDAGFSDAELADFEAEMSAALSALDQAFTSDDMSAADDVQDVMGDGEQLVEMSSSHTDNDDIQIGSRHSQGYANTEDELHRAEAREPVHGMATASATNNPSEDVLDTLSTQDQGLDSSTEIEDGLHVHAFSASGIEEHNVGSPSLDASATQENNALGEKSKPTFVDTENIVVELIEFLDDEMPSPPPLNLT